MKKAGYSWLLSCVSNMDLIYSTRFFGLYQCPLKRCFLFKTPHKQVSLNTCQLLILRKKIAELDVEAHFYAELNPFGMEILLFNNRQEVLILNTQQLIDLKQLFNTAFRKLICPREALVA